MREHHYVSVKLPKVLGFVEETKLSVRKAGLKKFVI